MDKFIADLHIHSRYSLATSPDIDLPNLSKWAGYKGISCLGTGDFTHPEWIDILEKELSGDEYGMYRFNNIYFILTAEVSNIYFKAGKVRKVHNMIFAPSFKIAREINKSLSEYGNLSSDGRPILKLECDRLVKKVSNISPEAFIVPAHIWTPHFSVFGSNSGFDKFEECFEGESDKIFALETGLSSDPSMSERASCLDRFSLISNSDAHSFTKLGREANVFNKKFTYRELIEILKTKDRSRFLYTIEFFPEEGKYYWDGHRPCEISLSPLESKNVFQRCPKCTKPLTVGVLSRCGALSDRKVDYIPKDPPAFKSLVPLIEIISEALLVGKESRAAEKEYLKLIGQFGSEFDILIDIPENDLVRNMNPRIAQGIINLRNNSIKKIPGYDGVFGKIKVLDGGKNLPSSKQMEFF